MTRLLSLLFLLCVGALADQCTGVRCVGSWSYCGYEETDNATGLTYTVYCNPLSSYCYTEDSSWTKGICIPLADEGDYCEKDKECRGRWLSDGGDLCRDNKCISTGLYKGDRCKYSESCLSGKCWNGRCTEIYYDNYVLKGAACDSSLVCEPGTACVSYKCVPIALDGDSCNGTACFGECSSDNKCDYLSRGEGENCTNIYSCKLGLICLGDKTCVDPESIKILNTSCSSSFCDQDIYDCGCDSTTQKMTCQIPSPLTQDEVDYFERVNTMHLFYKNSTQYEGWYEGYRRRQYGAETCGEDFSGSSSFGVSLLLVLAALYLSL